MQRRLFSEEFHLSPKLWPLGWKATELSCLYWWHCASNVFFFEITSDSVAFCHVCNEKEGFVSSNKWIVRVADLILLYVLQTDIPNNTLAAFRLWSIHYKWAQQNNIILYKHKQNMPSLEHSNLRVDSILGKWKIVLQFYGCHWNFGFSYILLQVPRLSIITHRSKFTYSLCGCYIYKSLHSLPHMQGLWCQRVQFSLSLV